MSTNLFAYIFRHSLRQQVYSFLATIAYLPVLYLTFELPKLIVNEALDADPQSFPRTLLGGSFSQLELLFVLCGVFLALVLLAGAIRYFLSVYKGVLGEIMLRRLRYDLYTRILQFPLAYLDKLRGGEIVTMATAEAEPIGRYMGVAVANPTLLGGTLLTALVFLFAQDMWLGLAAVALFPLQALLVPVIQKKMNAESRKRLAQMRQFAGHVSETIDATRDIRAHDTSAYELARVSHRLGLLFRIRRRLYELGNSIIFLNSFFTQLTPFFFYAVGGYLVIMDDLSLGALVAAIAAYREAAGPWNELLEYYQSLEDNRVKFAALVQNFMPDGLRALPPCERVGREPTPIDLSGELKVANLSLRDGEDKVLDSVDFSCALPAHIAIVGPAASGKTQLAEVLCALRPPSSGQVVIGRHGLSEIDEADLGLQVAYLDARSHVFTGSWWENLVYGFQHQPLMVKEKDDDGEGARVAEALAAGNTPHDAHAQWVMPQDAGLDDIESLRNEGLRLIELVELDQDVFDLGMRASCDAQAHAELSQKLLAVREAVRGALARQGLDGAVERFHPDQFLYNATLGENFLYGRPRDDTFSVSGIAMQPYATEILKRHDLYVPLLHVGYGAAKHMVELFKNVSEDDEKLARFNLFDQSQWSEYEVLLTRAGGDDPSTLSMDDKSRLYTLAFSLAPAHQPFELDDSSVFERIIAARRDFVAEFPSDLRDKLDFFAEDEINPNVTVRCNILFGRLDRRRMPRHDRIREVINEAVADAGLRHAVCSLGLDAPVGTAGAKLAVEQKQKLCLARCLLKKPKLLIVNEGISALEGDSQERVRRAVLEEMSQGSVVWVDSSADKLEGFDRIIRLRNGRVISGEEQPQESVEPRWGEQTPKGYASTVQLLDETRLLKGANPELLSLLAYAGERIVLCDGDALFPPGTELHEAYVLLSGEVELSVGAQGQETPVCREGPGTVLGELALLSDVPAPVCVKAVRRSEVLRISRELFADVMAKDAQFATNIARHIAARMVETMTALEAVDSKAGR